jgi:ribosome maturation protein Sdo1
MHHASLHLKRIATGAHLDIAKMHSLAKLIFTPHSKQTSKEHPHTYVLIVDEDSYNRHRSGQDIPLAEIVDTFSIFKYENPGNSGTLERPSQRELEEVFGMTEPDGLVRYMLANGKLHGSNIVD